jgi:vacuolar-type H+-ATPase subunit C/Vma6
LVKAAVERSQLLSEDKLKTLTRSENLQQFASELKETSYEKKLTEASLPNAARLERIFREKFAEVAFEMVHASPENASRLLQTYLLKIEHENVKTILRATSFGLSHDEIISKIYMPVERFLKRSEIIATAVASVDVKSVVEALEGTVYGPLLFTGLRKYEETRSTKFFDILLDRIFYENLGEEFEKLPKKERKHAFFYVGTETDSFNLLMVLRAKISGYDSQWIRMAIAPKFYDVDRETIETLLISENFESAFNIARQSNYGSFFVKADTPEETVSMAEKAFRTAMLEHVKKTRVGALFNVGVPLALIAQKEAEVYNLTAISLGIRYGWKPDDIQHLLIL